MNERNINRRTFLEETALIGAALSAMRAEKVGAGEGTREALPQIQLGNLKISRLILGSNPFFGFSHRNSATDAVMKAFYQDEQIIRVLEQAAEWGITAVAAPPYPRWINLYTSYRQKGGKLGIWIAQPDTAPEEMKAAITDAAKGGAAAIFIQGEKIDTQVQAGKWEVIREWIEIIKEHNLPAGMASHRPDVHLEAEKRKIPTDFYFQCFFQPDKFLDEDRVKAVAAIRQIEKPVVGYKILAAGRIKPEEGFAYAFKHLRRKDGVCVGVYIQEKEAMIRENTTITRKLSIL